VLVTVVMFASLPSVSRAPYPSPMSGGARCDPLLGPILALGLCAARFREWAECGKRPGLRKDFVFSFF
jgi:hypothetical protein